MRKTHKQKEARRWYMDKTTAKPREFDHDSSYLELG